MAFEGGVWGKGAKGPNIFRGMGAVTSLLETHLEKEGMPSAQPPLGSLAAAAG